jgi:hypothetical protein
VAVAAPLTDNPRPSLAYPSQIPIVEAFFGMPALLHLRHTCA